MPHATATCVGEPLALVDPAQLDAVDPVVRTGGAEANVAVGLARYGVPVSYVGRVGDDPEGRTIRAHLQDCGVDVAALQAAPGEFTGRYAKTEGLDADGQPQTASRYRRAGSAAARMGRSLLSDPDSRAALRTADLVHLTGITPALSASCRELAEALVERREAVTGRITFDINWRPALWPDRDPSVVVRLADHSDVVLVGADEAEVVLGTADPRRIRALLPRPEIVVVKDGAVRALALTRDGLTVEAPALGVDVVEPVGAGDSFAAGFLHGVASGEELSTCLRRGHIGAAATLTVRGDAATPSADVVTALLAADASDWSAATVTADAVRIGGKSFSRKEIS